MNLANRILVAPLNWGLGHATRCIPIIKELINNGFIPILASDGIALDLLKKEFTELEDVLLPSYNITYSKTGRFLKAKFIKDSPKMLKAVKEEKALVEQLVTNKLIDGIISDNRLGVYNKQVPSVFISHQLNVLSGTTSWLSSKIHQKIINKFDECWVPDVEYEPNLSGKLGHLNQKMHNVKYIGPISRFKAKEQKLIYDLLVILSGPEPQRTMLEDILLNELDSYQGSVVFIRGVIEDNQICVNSRNIKIYNYMESRQLEDTINKSKLVLSRSGYTTIMDLAKLEKKAFFIPTPGQYEQEFLAKRMDDLNLVPYCYQNNFSIDLLNKVDDYEGLHAFNFEINYKKLFSLFQSKRELTPYT